MIREWSQATDSLRKIVIATLDANTVEALKEKLGDGNYEIYAVQKGIDVLLKILDYDIDLLIVDVELAGFLGVEVLPVVRRLRPRLPIILITDDYNHRIRKVAAELGVNYQAFKPVSEMETEAIAAATEKIIDRNNVVQMN